MSLIKNHNKIKNEKGRHLGPFLSMEFVNQTKHDKKTIKENFTLMPEKISNSFFFTFFT